MKTEMAVVAFGAVIAGMAYFGLKGGGAGGSETGKKVGMILGSPTGATAGLASSGVSSPRLGETIVNFPAAETLGTWFEDESGNSFWQKGPGEESYEDIPTKKEENVTQAVTPATKAQIANAGGKALEHSQTYGKIGVAIATGQGYTPKSIIRDPTSKIGRIQALVSGGSKKEPSKQLTQSQNIAVGMMHQAGLGIAVGAAMPKAPTKKEIKTNQSKTSGIAYPGRPG